MRYLLVKFLTIGAYKDLIQRVVRPYKKFMGFFIFGKKTTEYTIEILVTIEKRLARGNSLEVLD